MARRRQSDSGPRFRFRIAAMGLAMIASAFGLLALTVVLAGIGVQNGHVGVAVVGLLAALAAIWLLFRCSRMAVVIDHDGIVVHNVRTTRRFAWAEVADVRPRRVSGWLPPGSRQLEYSIGLRRGGARGRGRVGVTATRTVLPGAPARLGPLFAVLEHHVERGDLAVFESLH